MLVDQDKLTEQDLIIGAVPQVRLNLETIRADVEEFGGKAYRMGKGSKDDAVVALLKDQLDEFKQVHNIRHAAHVSNSYSVPTQHIL